MTEALHQSHPIDEQMTEMYVKDQISYMEQRERGEVTPLEAYEVGHVSLLETVSVPESEIGVRPMESHAREVASELWRERSPFNQQNTEVFGSENERLEAMATVRGIADQARLTNKYFDGRHKRLGKQLAAGEIGQDEHDAAVGEIVAGLALTNPEKLREVSEAQRASFDRRAKAGQLPEGAQFVEVVSRPDKDGKMQLAGIDAVMAKVTGARDHAELAKHGMDIKANYYGEEALAKAKLRHEQQQQAIRELEAAQFEQQVRDTIDMLDVEDKKDGKKKD